MVHKVVISDKIKYYLESEVEATIKDVYQDSWRKFGNLRFTDRAEQKHRNWYSLPANSVWKKYIGLLSEDALKQIGKDNEWEIMKDHDVTVFWAQPIYVFPEIPTEPVPVRALNAHRRTLYTVRVKKNKREI